MNIDEANSHELGYLINILMKTPSFDHKKRILINLSIYQKGIEISVHFGGYKKKPIGSFEKQLSTSEETVIWKQLTEAALFVSVSFMSLYISPDETPMYSTYKKFVSGSCWAYGMPPEALCLWRHTDFLWLSTKVTVVCLMFRFRGKCDDCECCPWRTDPTTYSGAGENRTHPVMRIN